MNVYLDNASTTYPCEDVYQYIQTQLKEHYANPSSLHRLGVDAEKRIKTARHIIAQSIGASDKEIIFTSGGTEANNLAIQGLSKARGGTGRFITSVIEHPSVLSTFKRLEKLGYDVVYIPVDKEGVVDLETLKQALTRDTRLVSIMHVNNETGTIQPIGEIGQIITNFNKEENGRIAFHVDAVQSYGKLPISVKALKVDLLTISAHKVHGLKGTGALYVRQGIQLHALFEGGQQENAIRPGTENTLGIQCFAIAAEKAHKEIVENYATLANKKNRFIKGLEEMEELVINGSITEGSPYILNVSFIGTKGEILLHALESQGVFVSTGSACSSKKKQYSSVLEGMKCSDAVKDAAIRLSFTADLADEEIDYAITCIKQSVHQIRSIIKRR